MKGKRLPMPELALGSVAFALVGETGMDPDRLAHEQAEREQSATERAEFERRAQKDLFSCPKESALITKESLL